MANRKSKFIIYLLAVAIILLVLNIALEIFKKPKRISSKVSELSAKQIEFVFANVLDDYGVEANWVTKKKFKSPDEDSIKYQFFVKIPTDMPIPHIIKDINKVIANDITGFVSDEKKIFGETEIRIYSNEILKLKATLTPDKQIIRKRNELAFIISDAFTLNEKMFSNFLNVNNPLACTVVPGGDFVAKADSLRNFTKDYVVLMDDEITDPKMKLKSEYQKEILRSSVSKIVSSFKNAAAFIVDERSSLFKSSIYNFIKDDFKRNGIILHPRSEFVELNSEEDSDLFSKFKFYSEDTLGVHQKIFITSFVNFEKLQSSIDRYKKKGNKVIPLSKSFLIQKR